MSRNRFLPSHGTGRSVLSKPAAISKGVRDGGTPIGGGYVLLQQHEQPHAIQEVIGGSGPSRSVRRSSLESGAG